MVSSDVLDNSVRPTGTGGEVGAVGTSVAGNLGLYAPGTTVPPDRTRTGDYIYQGLPGSDWWWTREESNRHRGPLVHFSYEALADLTREKENQPPGRPGVGVRRAVGPRWGRE